LMKSNEWLESWLSRSHASYIWMDAHIPIHMASRQCLWIVRR
jgi:hypothetical protein